MCPSYFFLVLYKLNYPVSRLVTIKELSEKMNLKVETIVERFETAKKDSPIKKKLNCSENDEIWEIFRVRKIGNEKIILDKDYINKEFVENLTKEICEDSIYNYIENILGIKIAFAKKEITVSRVTEEDRKYLDVNGYDTIVVVKSFTYLENGSLFQYTESRHRPDRFRFVDFARRK